MINMKCKQSNDVSTLVQKYSPAFKKTKVNSERVTHESYIKLISWVALYTAVILCIVIGLTDNSVICMLSQRGLFFIVLRAMFIIFGLKSIIKQLLDLVFGFSHLKCIIKQLLDPFFVI